MSFKDINETVFQIKMVYFTKNHFVSFHFFLDAGLLAPRSKIHELALFRAEANDKLEEINFSFSTVQIFPRERRVSDGRKFWHGREEEFRISWRGRKIV